MSHRLRRIALSFVAVLSLTIWSCGEEDDNHGCNTPQDCLAGETCVSGVSDGISDTNETGVCKKRLGEYCVRHSECESGKCNEDEHRCRT